VREVLAAEPDEAADLAQRAARSARGDRPAATRSGKAEEVPVKERHDRDLFVHARADELERARSLTVHDVERALAVKPLKLLERLCPPAAIHMPWWCVYKMPADAVSLDELDAVGVPCRDNVHLMPGTRESHGEVDGVLLHPADSVHVSGNSHDAYPHE
jgi:hypothetical protein